MNIGDMVAVNFLMEVQGLEKDSYHKGLKVKGYLKDSEGHFYCVMIPMEACEVVDAVQR